MYLTRNKRRSEFEAEQLKTTEERLQNLETTAAVEDANLENYERTKVAIQEELEEAEQAIAEQQEELKALNEELDEKTKIVEQVKKTTAKSAKALDHVLKEIASKVCGAIAGASFLLAYSCLFKNDEIEKSGLERSAIYRKCRLEEIKLPLIEGQLKNVPMEEVCIRLPPSLFKLTSRSEPSR